jgi:alkaline phosphatase
VRDFTTPRRSRFLLPAAVIATAAILIPSAALAGIEDNHGATRNGTDRTSAIKDQIKASKAKNVIILIGDGMGDSEITIARNYTYGAAGRLPGIDALPLTGQYTTYSLYKDGDNKGKPDYVPDSAATGTAWATGTKTYDNAVSVDIDGVPQDTILEIAKANGYKTGNVSTAEIQDATPAVQVAHVDARSCYGPDSTTCGDDALLAGGLGSISEQLLDTRPDVTLGGGSASFTQTAKAGQWEGKTLFEQATDRGYQVVDTAAELTSVTKASQSKPLLGLFTPGNFPTRYAATTATVGGANTAVTCTENPDRLETGLSLASLTTKAIGLLKTPTSSKKGFFLQVEGASIDKQDHAANACGQIGETIDFDEAVKVALDFAKKDRNTLVIVTADHAHSSQIVDSTPPTSLSSAVTTADGTVMKISYGTASAGGSQQHTGSQLRIAGYGPGAANVVGLTDQTDTFFTMARSLKLDRDVDDLSFKARAAVSKSTVAPGAALTVSVKYFAGDRQLAASQGDEAIGVADAISGSAKFTITAPTTKGVYTVKVTGAQTGKVVKVSYRVK